MRVNQGYSPSLKGKDIWYDPDFRMCLEHHLDVIKSRATSVLKPKPVDFNIHQYDFYQLLGRLGISYNLHWIIMRINGYDNPYDYAHEEMSKVSTTPTIKDVDEVIEIKVIDTADINDILSLYLTNLSARKKYK